MSKLTNNSRRFASYWRSSLLDGQSSKGALSPKDASEFLALELGCLSAGTVPKALTDKLFERNITKVDENESLNVIFHPYVFRATAEHAESKETIWPLILAPVCARAKLTKDGRLTPIGKVIIGRDVLEPSTGSGYMVGSVEQLDTFLTECPCPSFEAVQLAHDSQEYEQARLEQWQLFINYCEKLLNAMPQGGAAIESGGHYKRTQNWFIKAIDDDGNSVTRSIVTLYDHITESKEPLPLFEAYSRLDQSPLAACLDRHSAFARHVGHSHSEYPLAGAQRDALVHLLGAQQGEVIAVNGPPGTGKTTMLLSVVASLWIKAALAKSDPPVIVVASTNNQAVTNVIDAFGKDFSAGNGPLAGRWLPDLNSFGVFLSSELKKKEASKKYQTQDFYTKIEDEDYLGRAKAHFLEKAGIAYPESSGSVKEVVETIHEQMLSHAEQLEFIDGRWKDLSTARDNVQQWLAENPNTNLAELIEDLVAQTEYSEQGIALYQSAISEVEQHKGRESWIQAVLNFIPSIKNKRLIQHLHAISNEIVRQEVQKNIQNPEQILPFMRHKVSYLEGIRIPSFQKSLDKLNAIQGALQRTSNIWNETVERLYSGQKNPKAVTIADVNDLADTDIRFPLFLMATHYWEGRWLLEMEQSKAYTADVLRKNGHAAQTAKWRRRMMVTPCLVSTFFTLPNQMTCVRKHGGEFVTDYLYNFIDLLVIDEAGQVLPEVAGASFALAKQALVVGDTDQIEPIYGVTKSIDYGNLIQAGLLEREPSEVELDQIVGTGKLASSGSVMALARHVNHYHQHKHLARGLYLVEHRRCFDEIIGYCNDLCYQGALIPKRGSLASTSPHLYLPALGYLHVSGVCERGATGSRVNYLEAQTIAHWIVEHRERLEALYGKPLQQLIGVVTPFSGQKALINKVLGQVGIAATDGGPESVTVGTVHALQGAERAIVIFSPVYSKHSDGSFIDQRNSMLNVAVSRAKDSFLVFGDMDLFNSHLSTPRGKLAQRLFGCPENEIFLAKSLVRQDLLKPGFEPRFLHDSQEHDAFLVDTISSAKERILIVSPWLKSHRLQPFKKELSEASKRGVKTIIYTDIGFNKKVEEPLDAVLDRINRIVDEYAQIGVQISIVENVHSKVLARDKDIICLGSFNWFSAVREAGANYRNHESSVAYSGPAASIEIEAHQDILNRRLYKY